MSIVLDDCYPPMASDEGLERLVILDAAEDHVPAKVWDAVHAAVQQVLEELDVEVRRRVPQVAVSKGRTAGRAFPVFSYRTYRRPETSDVDVVIAGVDCLVRDGGITMQADVSGEQGGDIIVAASEETCQTDGEQLVATARRMAGQLRHAGPQIAETLLSVTAETTRRRTPTSHETDTSWT